MYALVPVGRRRISSLDSDLPHQLFEILLLLSDIIVFHTVRGALSGERGRECDTKEVSERGERGTVVEVQREWGVKGMDGSTCVDVGVCEGYGRGGMKGEQGWG